MSKPVRAGSDDECILRFLFQKGHIRNRIKKQGVNVAPHPETGRLELSMFLLDSLSIDSFWDDMSRLGDRGTDPAKGFGSIACREVRSLQSPDTETPFGLDVEVNHNPHDGHCDVVEWSENAEERMSQQIEFAKRLNPRKRPSDLSELTPEQEYLRDRT